MPLHLCVCAFGVHCVLHITVHLHVVVNDCVLFFFPSGYTINIYVEMFHSEKQFDELEIFDGTVYFLCICYLCTPRNTHTHTFLFVFYFKYQLFS